MSYRLTVRRGPQVEKATRDTLTEALDTLEAYATTATRRNAVEFVSRRYEPGDLVALRIELKGDGVRAGLDVHGDGTAVAWTGRLRRAVIEPERGESPLDALRRAVTESESTRSA
ncbi:hypothetical protein [Solirubrobacter soli]|uniref:hypothetical protein n=1 Tax=Solirubrobacter soli TaxID=363832 RepID=UPI000403782C|nr:hypothetical protein [Solirubrobacter soli]